VKKAGPSPAKRRKSEPEPEEFRVPKDPHAQVGLGVIIGDDAWPTERPQPRRTASDSETLNPVADWQPRSPTPPPVPNLPVQYRGNNHQYGNQASSEGHFFALSLLSALWTRENKKLAVDMEAVLGLGRVELEEMRGDLAGVYDRWRLERGMRKVSLEDVNEPGHQVSLAYSLDS